MDKPHVAIIEVNVTLYPELPSSTLGGVQVENMVMESKGLPKRRMLKIFGKSLDECIEKTKQAIEKCTQ